MLMIIVFNTTSTRLTQKANYKLETYRSKNTESKLKNSCGMLLLFLFTNKLHFFLRRSNWYYYLDWCIIPVVPIQHDAVNRKITQHHIRQKQISCPFFQLRLGRNQTAPDQLNAQISHNYIVQYPNNLYQNSIRHHHPHNVQPRCDGIMIPIDTCDDAIILFVRWHDTITSSTTCSGNNLSLIHIWRCRRT